MNVIDLRQKYMAIASFIYVYGLTAINNTFVSYNKAIIKHRDAQHHAAVWIYLLIALIAGGLVLAGLMWACKKFGGGRSFAGEFKILGQYVKIKCS